MKKIVLFVMCVFLAYTLTAQDREKSENGITSSDTLGLQITTLPEVCLSYTKHFTFPFLQGENPLTSGNNIDVALTAEVTPISLLGRAEAILTPIAFFQFAAGGMLASGWNAELFGMEIYGIGINRERNDNTIKADGSPFDGVHWKLQTGGAFQMDLAAIIPGDWNHIVFRTYHEINYRSYSKAKDGESWFFQNDTGENQNGFNYYGNYLLGYQMPIFLNTIGLMAESDLYLYDTPNGGQWGDDQLRWTFSGVAFFTITKQLEASLIVQMRTRRNYEEGGESELELDRSVYYRNRHLDHSNPLTLEFYRAVFGITYTF